MQLISIDPSVHNSGIALFDNRNVINVGVFNLYELCLYLNTKLPEFDYIVFEASNKQKAVWGKNMRCVGQVDGVCNAIRQAVESENKRRKKLKLKSIILKEISPLGKGAKIPAELMQLNFPQWKITQDIADAIKIGERFAFEILTLDK